MKKLFVIILVLVGLVATNPSSSDFNDYITREVATEVSNTIVKYTDSKAATLSNLAGKIAANTTDLVYERKNYYIFSIYESKISHTKYLGVGKTFISLDFEEQQTAE